MDFMMLMPWYMELKGEKEGEGSVRGAGGRGRWCEGEKEGEVLCGGNKRGRWCEGG